MKKSHIAIFLLLLIFVVIINIVIGNRKANKLGQNNKAQSTPIILSVTQKVGGSTTQRTIGQNQTALDLLVSSAQIKTKGSGKDAFVTEINGRAANDSAHEFWAFYVNGKQAQLGAGSYLLKNNDTIEWKIEKY